MVVDHSNRFRYAVSFELVPDPRTSFNFYVVLFFSLALGLGTMFLPSSNRPTLTREKISTRYTYILMGQIRATA